MAFRVGDDGDGVRLKRWVDGGLALRILLRVRVTASARARWPEVRDGWLSPQGFAQYEGGGVELYLLCKPPHVLAAVPMSDCDLWETTAAP